MNYYNQNRFKKTNIIKKNKKQCSPPPSTDLSEEYKKTVCQHSRLGKKGYTIPKSILTTHDLEFLKKDLFMKPEIFGYGMQEDSNAFPVYRENDKKIYIPRFYGISRYGLPNACEIDEGHNIDVPFVKELRDYQDKIIDVYMKHVNNSVAENTQLQGGGGILEVPCGRGKCLGKDTPILMFNGEIKMVQDICVGDVIMGDDSTPRNVLSLARGREIMYKVHMEDGNHYIVNKSHILSLKPNNHISKISNSNLPIDISVANYLKLLDMNNQNDSLFYGYRVPISFPYREVNIDPYLLGYWLGMDNYDSINIFVEDINIFKHMLRTLTSQSELIYYLKKYNVINNRHIPNDYKCNDRKIQLELLAGLIDINGYNNKDIYYEIFLKNEQLTDDVIYLARSLGFSVIKHDNKFLKELNSSYYKVDIYGLKLQEIPVKYENKRISNNQTDIDKLTYKIRLEELGEDNYYGFEIDGNHRFVLGDFTVTHNTVMALKIISLIKKKTIILVHKEFLMNQWIERAQEFIPSARIGKIQGQICDTDDKDIVIGMIQSLYDKEYPQSVFSEFGLTIIDEVHRIGSEQFSKTLLKIITPYMLGISATVDRKDKLTKILYMFIGEKIYEEKRAADDCVCVRAIEYVTNDTEFNTVELDFRGKVKHSTMISKICDFGPRSEFIVRVINDLVIENSDAQIMILAHNRSLLTYLHDAIEHRNFATVGYYVGGMKEQQLKETESKQIVVATYAMAAEALDIKTLSILVMVTPKTDIIQSVGRILRMKHENPIVVDIVDTHQNFKNQWRQRKTYYRKNNYRIFSIDSKSYNGMKLDWSNNTTWKKVFEPKDPEKYQKSSDEEDETSNVGIGHCVIPLEDLE